jgi:hypothetical protein
MLKNIRQNHMQEISFDDAAGKSMQKGGRLSHYKKFSKAKKSRPHLASYSDQFRNSILTMKAVFDIDQIFYAPSKIVVMYFFLH